jgi:hypothetical protein
MIENCDKTIRLWDNIIRIVWLHNKEMGMPQNELVQFWISFLVIKSEISDISEWKYVFATFGDQTCLDKCRALRYDLTFKLYAFVRDWNSCLIFVHCCLYQYKSQWTYYFLNCVFLLYMSVSRILVGSLFSVYPELAPKRNLIFMKH